MEARLSSLQLRVQSLSDLPVVIPRSLSPDISALQTAVAEHMSAFAVMRARSLGEIHDFRTQLTDQSEGFRSRIEKDTAEFDTHCCEVVEQWTKCTAEANSHTESVKQRVQLLETDINTIENHISGMKTSREQLESETKRRVAQLEAAISALKQQFEGELEEWERITVAEIEGMGERTKAEMEDIEREYQEAQKFAESEIESIGQAAFNRKYGI